MKKLTTAAGSVIGKLQRLTIALDLGDRWSDKCVLDESGRILAESKVATSPNAMEAVFGAIGVGIVMSHDPLHRPGRALVSASGSYLGWVAAKRASG